VDKSRRERFLTGPGTAAAILALFWLGIVAGVREKSLGFDEVLHATAGFSIWRYGNYALHPENGNLPERMAGLPLALGSCRPPDTGSADWRNSQSASAGYTWLYESGNDADAMGWSARAACAVFAVALGALTWAWSRRLFGPRGGMVSLILYVLSPAILANGALVTSDAAAALFFMAATWGWWAVLHRVTPPRLIGSAVLLGGLFVSKMSAVLILPVMLVLAATRLCDGCPLPLSFRRWRAEIASRSGRAIAIAAAGAVHALVAFAVIWAFYGFRYSAFPGTSQQCRFVGPWEYVLSRPDPAAVVGELRLNPEQLARAARIFQAHGVVRPIWSYGAIDALGEIRRVVLTPSQGSLLDAIERSPPPAAADRAIDFFKRHELLPEAWLYGFATVLRQSQARRAFWNGSVSETGWPGFFPYAFLVKTPLGVFGVCILAMGAGWVSWKGLRYRSPGAPAWRAAGRLIQPTLPLWTLLSVYWAAAIASHLNIGHRHLLPIYAPLFILCGASAAWLRSPAPNRWAGPALCGLLGLLAAETFLFFPNYMAYFNGLVRPSQAYRHLVDSSLDWGQELPAARRYIDAHPEGRPYYLSYFGEASPSYYKVDARLLYSFGGPYLRGAPDFQVLKVPPDRVDEEVARLQRERPTFDLAGVGQSGNDVYAVFLRKAGELRLTGGSYLVSATMLQPVYYEDTRGPWNSAYEAAWRELEAEAEPLLSSDPNDRKAAVGRSDIGALSSLLGRFQQYRFARLANYLRHREPDDTINYGILVYRLTDADVERALHGSWYFPSERTR